MSEVHGFRVGEAGHGRRVEPHTDRETRGKVLVGRISGEQRRCVARGDAGGIAQRLLEVRLHFGGIDAAGVGVRGTPWAVRR